MTLQSVINQLIIHFCQKETFSEEEMENIIIEKKLESNRKAIIIAALQDLEKNNVVIGLRDGTWILSKSINNIGQDVPISIRTSVLISDVISSFLKANNIDHDPIDIFDIQEGHIQTLLRIINETLDTLPNKEN
jgi:hypothetical protein